MRKISQDIESNGYTSINIDYPSTKYPIEQLAPLAIEQALAHCPNNTTIHFVTHSMGGILVRQYLSQNTINNLGRVVMLAPPNHGSEVVDHLVNVPGFKHIFGPAGSQLGTDKNSIPNRLPVTNFQLGIIAGTRSINPLLAWMLPQPHDGQVSVTSTKLEGMNDHIELPVSHTFMMNNANVISQVIHFLKHGFFKQ